ncbi:MAG TPA: hypothetical protein VKP03_02300 [Patescibacteria group bacterium]|nr:hypothetical protein [Patescibacteria group bacterium]
MGRYTKDTSENLFCFVRSEFPLEDERIVKELVRTAIRMTVDGLKNCYVDTDFMVGNIYFTGQVARVKNLTGLIFVADIKTDQGQVRVEYLIAPDRSQVYNFSPGFLN